MPSKPLHKREKEELARLLAGSDIERRQELMAILEVFLASEGHQLPKDVMRRLKTRGLRFEPELVQQALDLFRHYGFAQAKRFADGETRYEHLHLGLHHDHLICTKCGRVEEFVDPHIEELQTRAARAKGFVPLEHRMDIYGLCRECAHRPGLEMPLCEARPGEKLLVCRYVGGSEVSHRLTDMGLHPGAEVEVLGTNGGPTVVACQGSRLALGRGLSEKVLVVPAGEPAENDGRT